jgi:hypothetical protein
LISKSSFSLSLFFILESDRTLSRSAIFDKDSLKNAIDVLFFISLEGFVSAKEKDVCQVFFLYCLFSCFVFFQKKKKKENENWKRRDGNDENKYRKVFESCGGIMVLRRLLNMYLG